MEQKETKKSSNFIVHENFKHTLPLQIRFNDIDALGHVNNSVYFPFFDLGKAQYFTTVKGVSAIDWSKTNIVVANVNCNFITPTYFNEKIAVQTKVMSIHGKSFKMLQQIINTETGEIKSQCFTIMVGFDVEKGIAAPIEQEWIELLNAFEGKDLTENK